MSAHMRLTKVDVHDETKWRAIGRHKVKLLLLKIEKK